MEILSIKKISGLVNEQPYTTLLDKGIRSESLYSIPAIKLVIKPDKWIDCFYRLFWENNYLHMPHTDQSIFINDKSANDDKSFNAFCMTITLAEVFDYLYDACPPLYREHLPDSTRNLDDIMALLETFLMEKSAQQEMYQSIFQKITKYGYFEKPNVIDLTYINAIRDHNPTGLVTQVIYATKPIQSFKDEHGIASGIFLLGMNNNTDVKYLIELMYKHQQNWLDVCDITKDSTYGMFIMTKYIGSMLNSNIKKSYSPFVEM
jgi:hypothetical protein